METSASFEARYAPLPYPTIIWLPDYPSVEQNIKLRNLQIFF
jgi:hypothetical protein